MNITRAFSLALLLVALTSLPSLAAPTAGSATLGQALALFKKGAYAQALEKLKPLKTDGLTSYWRGICQSRLQRFDQAAQSFNEASRLGFKSEDLEYERGQALYASQQLRPAREAFRKSLANRYKSGPSQFYIGFISQILEEFAVANTSYETLKALPRAQDIDKVKQPALLQLAELRYANAQTMTDVPARNRALRTDVLPKFETAMTYEPATPAFHQAKGRINEIRAALGSDVPRYVNGVPIPAKLWVVRAIQDVKYDSNVVAEADQAASRVSNAASVISKTSLFMKSETVIANRWSVSPDLSVDYTYHLSRNVGTVIANDQLSLTPALRLRNEHRYAEKPAAALFDIEFNYLTRKTNQVSLTQYSRYFNFVAGERARFLSESGNLTIQANFKILTHSDTDQSALEPGITLIQNLPMGGQNNLGLTLAVTDTIAKVVTYSKLNSRVGASWAMADLPWKLNATLGMDTTFSLLQDSTERAARGVEITLTPSLTLRKDLSPAWFMGASYLYTKQISDDATSYAYSKYALGLNLGAIL